MNDHRQLKELLDMLKTGNAVARERACEDLGKLRDVRAVTGLVEALGYGGVVPYKAAEALAQFGDLAVTPLLAATKRKWWKKNDQQARRRSFAAEALGLIGDKRTVEPLIALLRDPETSVRQRAAQALERIGDALAVEPMAALSGDTAPDVRLSAGVFLGRMGDPRAVDLLLSAAGGCSAAINAEKALSQMGPMVIDRLADIVLGRTAIGHGSYYPGSCWFSAIRVLREVSDPSGRAQKVLVDALAQSETKTLYHMQQIVEALTHRGWHPNSPSERVYFAISQERWDDAATGGHVAVTPLARLLHDGAWTHSNRATLALGRTGDVDAVRPLLDATRTNPDVVRTAVQSLERLLSSSCEKVGNAEICEIACLRQLVSREYQQQENSCYERYELMVDPSRIRELALAEMARRGLRHDS